MGLPGWADVLAPRIAFAWRDAYGFWQPKSSSSLSWEVCLSVNRSPSLELLFASVSDHAQDQLMGSSCRHRNRDGWNRAHRACVSAASLWIDHGLISACHGATFSSKERCVGK